MTSVTTGAAAPGRQLPVETDQVTVVVATRNRRQRLMETLPRHAAATVLVDNGSDDGSPEAVAAAFPHVDVVRLGTNLGAAARNTGVMRARTPYVAFADDDSYWTPGSLAHAAKLMDTHDRTALLAAHVLVGRAARVDPICDAMAAAPLGTPDGAPGPSVLGFLACAVVVRRDAFLAAGGFRPELFVYGEEALLAMDLAAGGWQLSYAPELTARHLPEPAGRDGAARRRMEARNRLLTAMLRRPPAVVAREALAAWRADPGAVRDAARLLPWVARNRRRVPDRIESDLLTLDA
jgi:N-acetylglucosaminyl-diphospho-decaprenol L-rhamnosyltransferase